MFKYILFLALTISSMTANADCDIKITTADADVNEVIKKYSLTFKNKDDFCKKLARENVHLYIEGNASVLDNVSIAWASVHLMDNNLPLVSGSGHGQNIRVNKYASQDQAVEMLSRAINNAIGDTLDFDLALKSLETARKAVKGR
jgi:hypothetical protein